MVLCRHDTALSVTKACALLETIIREQAWMHMPGVCDGVDSEMIPMASFRPADTCRAP